LPHGGGGDGTRSQATFRWKELLHGHHPTRKEGKMVKVSKRPPKKGDASRRMEATATPEWGGTARTGRGVGLSALPGMNTIRGKGPRKTGAK